MNGVAVGIRSVVKGWMMKLKEGSHHRRSLKCYWHCVVGVVGERQVECGDSDEEEGGFHSRRNISMSMASRLL